MSEIRADYLARCEDERRAGFDDPPCPDDAPGLFGEDDEPAGGDDPDVYVAGDGADAVTAFIDPRTGEIQDVLGAPAVLDDMDIEALAAWVGPKYAGAKARLAALTAERDAWQKVIDERYGPCIKREQGLMDWLLRGYRDQFRAWAAEKLAGKKERHTSVGFLKFSFRRTAKRIDVVDEPAALAYLRAVCPGAVKVEETILKSALTPGIKASVEEQGAAYGLTFIASEDTFTIE